MSNSPRDWILRLGRALSLIAEAEAAVTARAEIEQDQGEGPSQDELLALFRADEVVSTQPIRVSVPREDPYLTLDQIGALIGRSKRSMERYLYKMPDTHPHHLPEPDMEGGGGRPHMWLYSTIRPWIVKVFGLELDPDRPTPRRIGFGPV